MNLLTEGITLDEFSEMPLEAAVELLQKLGKGRFKNPEQLVKSIQKAVRSSYRLGKVTKNSIRNILHFSIDPTDQVYVVYNYQHRL
ncbi:hypothetical protein EfmAA55_27550 [Enterococcus faecium]|nr:hypothetical protein EfmAA55_27550 [Enterococcus faecium]